MLATQGNGGCMTEKVRKSEEERDAEVKKMLEDWDIVKVIPMFSPLISKRAS